jgi:hypothetical protein
VQILLRKPFDATQVAEIIANCLHSLTVRAQSQPTSSPAARKASQAPENESARVRT